MTTRRQFFAGLVALIVAPAAVFAAPKPKLELGEIAKLEVRTYPYVIKCDGEYLDIIRGVDPIKAT